MNLTTTGRKRLAGLAALAFGGSVLLGACEGEEGGFPLCGTLEGAISDLGAQIEELQVRQGNLEDTTSVEYDLLEVKITALERARDVKQDQFEAQCGGTDGQTDGPVSVQ